MADQETASAGHLGAGGGTGGSPGVEEADLRAGIRTGGRVLGSLVVARAGSEAPEYAIYVRPSWLRGYRILRTWRGKADRTYRTLDKLYKLPPVFGYLGPVTVYPSGCAELRRFRGVLAHDAGAANAGDGAVDSGDGTDDPAGAPW